MNCDCIEKTDNALALNNARLNCTAIKINRETNALEAVVTLNTEWIDPSAAPKGRKRTPPTLVASYCPFCGVAIAKGKEVVV